MSNTFKILANSLFGVMMTIKNVKNLKILKLLLKKKKLINNLKNLIFLVEIS